MIAQGFDPPAFSPPDTDGGRIDEGQDGPPSHDARRSAGGEGRLQHQAGVGADGEKSGLSRCNDFVVKFANVNGSGSASANRLFTKAILRMGVPATPRNVFPSNIEGLPTWYEVRISEANRLARHGEVHLLVAMNPQTWDKDVREIAPGGYLFYDSTRPLPPQKFRSDIVVLGVPLTAICNSEYSDARQRQLFKNIMYVGALSALLDIDAAEIERLIAEQFKTKEKLIAANLRALHLGRDHARNTLPCPIGLRLRRADAVGDRIFIDGNSAAALGAVYGGATIAAWYPITPSTSLAEAFQRYCRRYRGEPETGRSRYAIVQAEDELASIGMVVGAAWNGARAFTATSGPGISLMQETIGLAYFAEIPAVIFDVQRAGPSTGMPTRTQQADLLACAYASHGDTRHVLLFPEDPHECFLFGALAFDLADRLQTPVFVMLDLEIGMNERLTAPFTWDDARRMDRGKVMTAEALERTKDFGRYLDVDGDGIPWRTYPGTHPSRGAFFTRGSTKDGHARYTEEGAAYVDNVQRLLRKFATAKRLVPTPVLSPAARLAPYGAVYYGSTSPAMDEAREILAERGIPLDLMRIRAFPFQDEVMDFIAAHERVFVVEQNRDAQMRTLLVNEGEVDPKRLHRVLSYDGTPITSRFIVDAIAGATDLRHPVPAVEEIP
jgi:2-oxoglutarate ferredoxin oxidoreductase subunit alpha